MIIQFNEILKQRNEATKQGLRLNAITMAELQKQKFPPRQYIVPGLIPARGLTLLVAKPKMRKSFFVLDLAICVSMKQKFLSLETKQGAVLYVTLEDDSQRI